MSIRIDGTNSAANPGITGADDDSGVRFGTDEVAIVTGGTDRVTVDSSGNLSIAAGNLVFASGSGIDFSANAHAAGMTSELLDDYEEGTWTPSVTGWTSITYGTLRNGYYTKVGRQVFASFYIQIGSATSAGTAVTVTGLPFANNTDNGSGGSLTYYDAPTNTVNHALLFLTTGSTDIDLYEADTGATIAANGNISSTKYLCGVISYFV